jgi:thiamine-monophosphate kinase
MEFDLIERVRDLTAQARDDVLTGIGDDAAILAVPAGRELAVAMDTLVAGVHFPSGTRAFDIGWKALAVNLSDLAAMGAVPAWALLSMTLPDANRAFVEGLAEGFAALAAPHRVALVGGDTTRGPLSVTVAVHGFLPSGQGLLRSGANVGDVVMVTGTLGDAAAGLRCVGTGRGDDLVARLDRPTPRVAAGGALRGVATACIDISDGLVADLGHICQASGVAAELDPALLPRSEALRAMFADGDSTAFALTGGDDYELCFTLPSQHVAEVSAEMARLGCGATRIGRIVAGQGVRLADADGQWRAAAIGGWDHFAP